MKDCVFCRIIEGSIPAQRIYEDEKTIVIRDINPVAPVHLLVIPKTHIEGLNELTAEQADISHAILMAARKAAGLTGIDEDGYRLVNNCGEKAGQTVMHLHFHVLGGTEMRELKI
ncbi:MAG: histidine triad nucleotide-binding protein [Clostridia bacterium]